MGCRRRRVEIIGDGDVVGSSSGSIDFQDILPKRKNNQPEHNSDRLSELHDSLLVEILSLLPMEDAIRSGILCKRWKSLWTLVDRFRFPYTLRFDERFTSFVDHTLMQCSCPNLKEFSLSFYFTVSEPAIEKCLQYVSSKNVKILILEASIFCEIQIMLSQLSWLSLEKLSLSFIDVDDKEIADILLGCPLLDTLILYNVSGPRHLNIASPKLRKLKFKSAEVASLEVNAPCLQELELIFSGNLKYLHYCGLVDVSSLVFAKIMFADANVDGIHGNGISLDTVIEILKKLHHVEELIVGPLLIEALTVLEVLRKPSPLFKCKKLTIESLLWDQELPGIACLLQRSPDLETLVIQPQRSYKGQSRRFFWGIYNVNGKKYLNMQKQNLLHLKTVNFVYRRRNLCLHKHDTQSLDFEVEVMAYLRKNARLLDKFVITSQISDSCECSINCSWQLAHKLMYNCFDGNEAAKCEFRTKQSEFEFVYLARGRDK